MMKCNKIKKLKAKKNFTYNDEDFVAFLNIKNDFCYFRIKNPWEPWKEPLNSSYSLAPVSHSSVKMEKPGDINYFISSLQANREINKIINKEKTILSVTMRPLIIQSLKISDRGQNKL